MGKSLLRLLDVEAENDDELGLSDRRVCGTIRT